MKIREDENAGRVSNDEMKISYLQLIQEPICRMSTISAIFKGFAATATYILPLVHQASKDPEVSGFWTAASIKDAASVKFCLSYWLFAFLTAFSCAIPEPRIPAKTKAEIKILFFMAFHLKSFSESESRKKTVFLVTFSSTCCMMYFGKFSEKRDNHIKTF